MKFRPIPTLSPESIEAFWALVLRAGPSDCWLWQGGKSESHGHDYGVWHHGGVSLYVHRVAYTLAVGPIPDGLTIDHVRLRGCSNTSCCNPGHLEAVTLLENLRRRRSQRKILACACGAARLKRVPRCRDCNNAFHRQYRHDHPEKWSAIAKASYERKGRKTRQMRDSIRKAQATPLRAHDYL